MSEKIIEARAASSANFWHLLKQHAGVDRDVDAFGLLGLSWILPTTKCHAARGFALERVEKAIAFDCVFAAVGVGAEALPVPATAKTSGTFKRNVAV